MFNRRTTLLTALLETAIWVVSAIGILLIPFTVLFIFENNDNADWMSAFRTAADIWLSGHGVNIWIAPGKLAGIKVSQFTVGIVPLGYSLLIYSGAYRLGRKLAATSSLWPGWLAATGVYVFAASAITSLAYAPEAHPVAWQGAIYPPLSYVAVLVLTSLFAKPHDELVTHEYLEAIERTKAREWVNSRFDRMGWVLRVVAVPALKAGTAVVAMLVGIAALAISVLLAVNWISVIRLYEGLQLSVFGVILVTVAQIAFLPNLVVLGATWFTGVGFSIGIGSLVSPLGTQLGPIPSIPIFAVLPVGELSWGMVAVAVPLVAAAIATASVRKYTDELRFEFAGAFSAALTLGIAIGAVAALEMGLLAWLASGSAGPERLTQFGAVPWMVALVLFVEVTVIATLVSFVIARPEQPDADIMARQGSR